MAADERTSQQLADAFETICPTPERLSVPDGYRDSAFALIDAIFSMQARYEGARRVVANYAAWAGELPTPGLPVDASTPDEHTIADLLGLLKAMPAVQAAEEVFDNRARSPRANKLKAELVVEAANAFTMIGLRTRGDVAALPTHPEYPPQKQAWSRIHGLGPVTFEYFRMLCGAESSKPDIMILGWLQDTLGVRYSWQQALLLMDALTDELTVRWDVSVSQRAVDHTIWRHQSGRGLDPDAPVGWNADVSQQPT